MVTEMRESGKFDNTKVEDLTNAELTAHYSTLFGNTITAVNEKAANTAIAKVGRPASEFNIRSKNGFASTLTKRSNYIQRAGGKVTMVRVVVGSTGGGCNAGGVDDATLIAEYKLAIPHKEPQQVVIWLQLWLTKWLRLHQPRL